MLDSVAGTIAGYMTGRFLADKGRSDVGYSIQINGMNILRRKPGRIITIASIFAYSLVLLYGAVFAFNHPVSNWDTLPYMDLVLISEGQSAQRAHAAVYQDIRGNGRARLATDNVWEKALAASPELFTERLPFSDFKVGYIFLIRAFQQAGLGLLNAAQLVSVLAYVGIGVVFFLWMLRYTSAPLALVFGGIVMLGGSGPNIVPQGLAQIVTPDGLAAMFIFLGFYLLLETEALLPGLLTLLVCLFFRMDVLIYLLVVLAWLVLARRLKPYQAAVLGLTGCTVVWVLERFSGNFGWTVLFNDSFFPPTLHPAGEVARVSAGEYVYFFLRNLHVLMSSFLPLLLLLGLVSFLARPKCRVCIAALLAVLAIAVRYVLYPSPDPRFYAPAVLICMLAMFAVLLSIRRADAGRGDLSPTGAGGAAPMPG